ncbi:MAG: hypothetical protein RMJ19_11160, partial [Gemmatales bacterium]|nr:hypothetical protein [Gemmatales bacterium]MDW8176222.1 hypothetical protein [Gemmatales bacterium]
MHAARLIAISAMVALAVAIVARPTHSHSDLTATPMLVEIRPNPPVIGYPVRITVHHPLLDVHAGQLQWRDAADGSPWHPLPGCELLVPAVSEKPVHLQFRVIDSHGHPSAPLEIRRTPVSPAPQLWVISTEPAEGPNFGQPFRIHLVAQSPLLRPVHLEWRPAGQTSWQRLNQSALTLENVSTLNLRLEFRAVDDTDLPSPPLRASWSVNPLIRSYPVAQRAGFLVPVPLHTLALIPRTDTVLVGGERGFLALLDLITGNVSLLTGHDPEKTIWSVAAVRTSRDEWLGLSASDDGTALLWDLRKRAPRLVFRDHVGGITAVAFSPDGLFAFTGGQDGFCLMWDTESGKVVQKMEISTNAICTLRSWTDGKEVFLAAGDASKRVSLWNALSGKPLASQPADHEQVGALAVSPDLRLLSVGRLPLVRYWRYSANAIRHEFDLTPESLPEPFPWPVQQLFTGVDLTPDGKYAVACDSVGRLTLWRVDDGVRLRTYTLPSGIIFDPSMGFSAIQVTPDGQKAL